MFHRFLRASALACFCLMPAYALVTPPPELCTCFASSTVDHFGKIQSTCPNLVPCVIDDSQDPPIMGECYVKETSVDHFWCKCFDGAGDDHWTDDCLCRSGWRWSPTQQQAHPHCARQDCSYTCFTVPDADIPPFPGSIQNCHCTQ